MGNKGSSSNSSLRISSQRFDDLRKETGSQEEERAIEASRRLVLLRKYEYYAGIEFAGFDDDRSATAKELSVKSSEEVARRKYRERKSNSFASSNRASFSSPLQLQRQQEEKKRQELIQLKKQQQLREEQRQEQKQEQERKQEQEQKQEREPEPEQEQELELDQEIELLLQPEQEQEQEQQQEQEQDQDQDQEQDQEEQEEQEQQEQQYQQKQKQKQSEQVLIKDSSMIHYEDLLRKKKITPKAAKSLEAFTGDVMRWILDEADRRAMEREREREKEREQESMREDSRVEADSDDEEDFKEKKAKKMGATITSENIQGAIQSLLCVSEEKGKQDFEKRIQESIRTFFDLLHFGDWTFVVRKHDVHVMRVRDPDFLCIRATTTMKGSPAEILDCILDFDAAPTWDLLLKSSEPLEYIDSQTAVLHSKYVAEYCLLKEARDFVSLCRWFWRAEDSSLVFVARSVDHPLGLLAPGYVRGNMLTGGYLISPLKGDPNVSRVTRLIAVDVVKAPEFILDTVAQVQASVIHRFKAFCEHKIEGMRLSRRSLPKNAELKGQ